MIAAAALNGDSAVIAALLEAGADPNARNRLQATPLHLAVELIGNPVLVAELAGADELNGNLAVVEALLDAGTDAKVRDGAGKTALELAQDNRALEESGAYRRLNDASF